MWTDILKTFKFFFQLIHSNIFAEDKDFGSRFMMHFIIIMFFFNWIILVKDFINGNTFLLIFEDIFYYTTGY